MKTTLLLMLTLAHLSLVTGCGKPNENTEKTIYVTEKSDDEQEDSVEEEIPPVGGSVEYFAKPFDLNFESLYIKGPRIMEFDRKFISITDKRNLEVKELNYIKYPKGTRELLVTGKHILLDNEDIQGIVALIQNSKDLLSFTIEAEKVTIDIPLKLHQTNVLIKADIIDFKQDGSINTTGDKLSYPGKEFEDGINGLNAGEINILVRSHKIDSDRIVLIASGGDGQDAGAGRDGARGTNARIVKGGHFWNYKKESCKAKPGDRGGAADHHKAMVPLMLDCKIKTKDKGAIAGNGQPAKVGGAPGIGGEAGNIISNSIDLIERSEQKNGVSGKEDIIRVGGSPGSPATTCVYVERRRGVSNETNQCNTAVKGKDVSPKKSQTLEISEKKGVLVSDDWFSESVAYHMLNYIEQQYINGHMNLALTEIYKLKSINSRKKSLYSSQQIINLKLLKYENQIVSRLDYFGNQKTWSPSISFAISYKLFEKEIQSGLKGMFYGSLLVKEHKTIEDKKLSIINSQEALYQELVMVAKDLNEKIKNTSRLGLLIDNLVVSEVEFKAHLKQLDAEIREKAKNKLIPKGSFLNQAVGYFAAASKVIPVGQPTFGLMGAGVEMVHAMGKSDDPIREIIENGPSLVNTYRKMDLKGANHELRGKLDRLSLKKLTELEKPSENETNKEKIERVKREIIKKKQFVDEMVGFYKPVVDAIKEQNTTYSGRQVSRSALTKEIEKLRRSNKIYQKVIKSLKKLMKQQAEVRSELAYVTMMITSNLNKITSNYIMISDLASELAETSIRVSHGLKLRLQTYLADSKERLVYYHYKLKRAFEYRTLKPYGRELDLYYLYTDIMFLLERGERVLTAADLEKLMTVYTNEISYIVSSFMDHLDEVNVEKTGFSKFIDLNLNEVDALNRGERIFIDLSAADSFGTNKENVRLENVEIGGEAEGSGGSLEVIVKHSPESILARGGKDFLFTHGSENKGHNFWMASMDISTGGIQRTEVDEDNLDTLRMILENKDGLNRLSSKPSARGIYTVEIKKSPRNKMNLKELQLELKYKFELIE